ncbi:MAG: LLM class F420-dependent oxidoreductase [Acidimicrobiia bacterium]
MKLGLALGPWDGRPPFPIDLVQTAERLGYDSVWTAETYGADAITQLAFIAARTNTIKLGTSIAQLDARTPANLAMCAQTIDAMAGGNRMMLGIGLSGPQIVEGWYGRPWGKPNRRLREALDIIGQIFRREGKVEHAGDELPIPYEGPGSSGLGKPLKSIMAATPNLPIILGVASPLNIKMAGELCDGWSGFHLSPESVDQYRPLIDDGLARRSDGRTIDQFDIQALVGAVPGDDVHAAMQVPKPLIAMYAGGMGARSMNFHKQAMVDRGFAEAADKIQDLYLAGRHAEAAAEVPDDYVDSEWLIGPRPRIAKRLEDWRDSGITTLKIRITTPDVLELIAGIVHEWS